MTIRVFTCRHCGHHMRFSDTVCHNCYMRKALWQMPVLLFAGVIVAVTLIIGLLIS